MSTFTSIPRMRAQNCMMTTTTIAGIKVLTIEFLVKST